MKTIFKPMLVMVAVMLWLVGTPARAQLGNPAQVSLNSTNAIPTASTNSSLSVKVPVASGKDVAFQIRFRGVGADTGNLVLKLSKSVDGTHPEDTAFFSWTIPANGTNYVTQVTNLTVNAVPAVFFTYQANTCTNAITNIVITKVVQ